MVVLLFHVGLWSDYKVSGVGVDGCCFFLLFIPVLLGVVCLQVKLCDPHLSALEVRFS